MKKLVRVLTYPDGRRDLLFNDPLKQSRLENRGGGRKCKDEITPEFMTVSNYSATLRRWYREELRSRYIDLKMCRWFTLTIARDMSWREFTTNLNQFLSAAARAFPKVEYLRAIEVQDETRRFHAHFIFCFSGMAPKNFTRTWITQTWKQGICHFDHPYCEQGLFQYLTKNKTNWYGNEFTSFPYGARVLKKSRGFGEIVKPTESFMPRESAITLTFQGIEQRKSGQGKYVRIDDCPCMNQATGETFRCWNRVYLPNPNNKKMKLKEIEL